MLGGEPLAALVSKGKIKFDTGIHAIYFFKVRFHSLCSLQRDIRFSNTTSRLLTQSRCSVSESGWELGVYGENEFLHKNMFCITVVEIYRFSAVFMRKNADFFLTIQSLGL